MLHAWCAGRRDLHACVMCLRACEPQCVVRHARVHLLQRELVDVTPGKVRSVSHAVCARCRRLHVVDASAPPRHAHVPVHCYHVICASTRTAPLLAAIIWRMPCGSACLDLDAAAPPPSVARRCMQRRCMQRRQPVRINQAS